MKKMKLTAAITSVLFSMLFTTSIFAVEDKACDAKNSSPDWLSPANARGINGFEQQSDLKSATFGGIATEITLNTDKKFVKQGDSSLRLFLVKPKDGKDNAGAWLGLTVDPTIDLSDYQAIGFWLYVSEESAGHFGGRNDISVHINGTHGKSWAPDRLRAIQPGWTYYLWEFDNFDSFPKMKTFSISIKGINKTCDTMEFYFDDFKLFPAEPIVPVSELKEIIANSAKWRSRYKAIKEIANFRTIETFDAIMPATADPIHAVRNLALITMKDIIRDLGPEAGEPLEKAFSSDNWETRRFILETVAEFKDEFGDLPRRMFEAALLDDVYYVRDFGLEQLIARGETRKTIADNISKKLAMSKDDQMRLKCIRMLDQIGPIAKGSVPQLLEILRNDAEPMKLRYWSLRAIWWLEEEVLTPQDWAIGLSLEPGEIHRRLLYRVTDRLTIAGEKAVPVLLEKLKDPRPEVRARAAAILGDIGKEAAIAVDALEKLTTDKEWYVGWEAADSLGQIEGPTAAIKKPSPAKPAQKDITATDQDDLITISNGLVEIVFDKNSLNPGPAIVRKPGGKNMTDSSWMNRVFAFTYGHAPSLREIPWLLRLYGSHYPKNVERKFQTLTSDRADFVMKFTDEKAPLQWEYHFVMEKGLSGFYYYFVVKNITGEDMPDSSDLYSYTGVGRINLALGVTRDFYDYAVLGDEFKSVAQMYSEPDPWNHLPKYTHVMNATQWLPDGQIWAKHEWEPHDIETDVTGYCGKNGGLWMIHPSRDFQGDSTARWTKVANYETIWVLPLESKYNVPSTVHVGEDFEKYYGPLFFYVNDGDNVEEMWVDAKRQGETEKASWPYDWITSPRYHDRGNLKGKLTIADGQSPVGAYIVLSNPDKPAEDQINVWSRNTSEYQYYIKIKNDDGRFEIPAIHQGSYDFFVFKPGVIGELRIDDINIATGKTFDIGEVELAPYKDGNIIWQIGIPDGGPMEFKNGRNYHQWDNWLKYPWDFPNDVHYVVGKSDWKTDWSYLQPACIRDVGKPITWSIEFELNDIPAGKVVLMMVCAGNGDLDVIVNDSKIGDLNVTWVGAHGRSTCYGELVQKEFEIDRKLLKQGTNKIVLTFAKGLATDPKAAEKQTKRWGNHIAYDFIRLEER